MKKVFILLLVIAGSITIAKAQDATADKKADMKDLRKDIKDKRVDQKDINADKKDIKGDVGTVKNLEAQRKADIASGDKAGAKALTGQIKNEKKDINTDKKDINGDRKERNADNKDIHKDAKDLKGDGVKHPVHRAEHQIKKHR
jgi:hypothetical protein